MTKVTKIRIWQIAWFCAELAVLAGFASAIGDKDVFEIVFTLILCVVTIVGHLHHIEQLEEEPEAERSHEMLPIPAIYQIPTTRRQTSRAD